ncbi:hypothetical protein [Solitalea longa]|nr:hypothetical protein [Solitalea longa]
MKAYFSKVFTFIFLFIIALNGFAKSPTQSRSVNIYSASKWQKTKADDSLYVKITGEPLTKKQTARLADELKKQQGVNNIHINYELATANIHFDSKIVSSGKLIEIINSFKSSNGTQNYRAIVLKDSSN